MIPTWARAIQQASPTARSRPTICAVIDVGLIEHEIVRVAQNELSALARGFTMRPCPLGFGSEPLEELASLSAEHDLVVAVGGGSVMDLCRLGRLVAADPTNLERLEHAGRSGVVPLPTARGASSVVCVPTTIGTGAERSGVAVWDTGKSRKLVTSPSLRADAAIYDHRATATLSADGLATGGLEVLLRLAGAYIGGAAPESPQDPVGEALAAETARRLHALIDTDPDTGRSDRMALARLSAAAHSEIIVRSVQGEPLPLVWVLANELATVLSLPKMTVLPSIVAPVWERALGGDTRFGHSQRLAAWWDVVATAWPQPLTSDPVAGYRTLLDHIGVRLDLCISHDQITRTAQRVVRHWASGLPYVSDLRLEDVIDVLEATNQQQHQRKGGELWKSHS